MVFSKWIRSGSEAVWERFRGKLRTDWKWSSWFRGEIGGQLKTAQVHFAQVGKRSWEMPHRPEQAGIEQPRGTVVVTLGQTSISLYAFGLLWD